MKKYSVIIMILSLFFSCNLEKNFSGPLDIPDAFLERFNLIHADPGKIDENILSEITLDKILEDIEGVRKYLGVEKIAVLGHSMFATLPLLYGAKYPDHLSYAISSGGAPSFDSEFLESAGDYWTNEASDERKKLFRENYDTFTSLDKSGLSASKVFILEYIAYVPYRFMDPQFDTSPLWEDVEINIPFINHYWENLMMNTSDLALYQKIEAPVLAISGKFDFGLPYYLWDSVKHIIPDLTTHVFKNAGHNPMLEVPGEYTKTIITWLESKN